MYLRKQTKNTFVEYLMRPSLPHILPRAAPRFEFETLVLKEMERYGIRGVAYNWMKNHIENRSQFVQMGNHRSVSLSISCGVPQGSVLGPKLFLKFTVFADDRFFVGGMTCSRCLKWSQIK